MQTVLAKIGPIIVSLNSELLLNYTGGIINSSTCSHKINHNALAVGYNKTGNYYIVKNSWGSSWGLIQI
jgi:cathepsin H